jgi:hypothetical protein
MQFAQRSAPRFRQISAQLRQHLIGLWAGGANDGNGTQASTARKGEDGLGQEVIPGAEVAP